MCRGSKLVYNVDAVYLIIYKQRSYVSSIQDSSDSLETLRTTRDKRKMGRKKQSKAKQVPTLGHSISAVSPVHRHFLVNAANYAANRSYTHDHPTTSHFAVHIDRIRPRYRIRKTWRLRLSRDQIYSR